MENGNQLSDSNSTSLFSIPDRITVVAKVVEKTYFLMKAELCISQDGQLQGKGLKVYLPNCRVDWLAPRHHHISISAQEEAEVPACGKKEHFRLPLNKGRRKLEQFNKAHCIDHSSIMVCSTLKNLAALTACCFIVLTYIGTKNESSAASSIVPFHPKNGLKNRQLSY